jgi:AhpD family alkylhydroperoxidase
MQTRISYGKVAHEGIKAMAALEQYLRTCGLEKSLLDLVMLRASQLNGCAVCMDAHWKELRGAGENEQRLYSLDAWRESPYYTERERAALAWAESITLITDGHVPDDVFEQARRQFDEKELVDLTLAAVSINSWNRVNIAFRNVPVEYRPAAARAARKDAA